MITPTLLRDYPALKDTVNAESYIFSQRKLDGWRCIIDTETEILYSRSGKIIDLPHVSADIKKSFKKVKSRYVDGELYAHGFNLHTIQSMIKKQDIRIQFNCFDVISDLPFSGRFRQVKKIKESDSIKKVVTKMIFTSGIDREYKKYLSEGYEGLIIRIDGHPYTPGRTEHIIRVKPIY